MGVWLAVGIGGALGSIARHGVNRLTSAQSLAIGLPLGTITVNVVGCFLIGVLSGINPERIPFFRFYWREFVFVGVLGGFTTYSAFGLDTHTLARSQPLTALGYVAIQIVGGLGAVWVGHAVAIAAGWSRA